MDIAVIGTGYVGLVSGTCFAEMGHEVTCVDIDEDKVARLAAEDILLCKPDLEKYFERARWRAGSTSRPISPNEEISVLANYFYGSCWKRKTN